MASVVAICICSDKGLPMRSVESVKALAGKGLEGDRYAEEKGAFSKGKRVAIRHVSLIAQAALAAANLKGNVFFSFDETRRNILTEGIDLNALVGKEFTVGAVRMRGTELCDPCRRPGKLVGKDGAAFESMFDGIGGLRAEILNDGVIQIGSPIVIH